MMPTLSQFFGSHCRCLSVVGQVILTELNTFKACSSLILFGFFLFLLFPSNLSVLFLGRSLGLGLFPRGHLLSTDRIDVHLIVQRMIEGLYESIFEQFENGRDDIVKPSLQRDFSGQLVFLLIPILSTKQSAKGGLLVVRSGLCRNGTTHRLTSSAKGEQPRSLGISLRSTNGEQLEAYGIRLAAHCSLSSHQPHHHLAVRRVVL